MQTLTQIPALHVASETISVVVMGVAGCGKTETSHALAAALHVECIEGDSYHSEANRTKMAAGIPLDDADRWSWLDALIEAGKSASATHKGYVMACSALRRTYRDYLRAGLPNVRFVFLNAPGDVIHARVANRSDHFMPVSLVSSQLATLEAPHPMEERDVLEVDATLPIEQVVNAAMAWVAPKTVEMKGRE